VHKIAQSNTANFISNAIQTFNCEAQINLAENLRDLPISRDFQGKSVYILRALVARYSRAASAFPAMTHLRPFSLPCLVLVLFSFSALVLAQETQKEKARDSDQAEPGLTGNTVKVNGSVHCSKPDPVDVIEVPDRSGHALMLSHRKCVWSAPLVILDAKTKNGISVIFTEKMEGTLHMHGYEVDTLDSGDTVTMRTMCQVTTDKGPANIKGRWSFMRGTGKFRGIKGGGVFEGKLEANDGLTLELEGVYVPAEMAGAKK
jgi:hypothetical protein